MNKSHKVSPSPERPLAPRRKNRNSMNCGYNPILNQTSLGGVSTYSGTGLNISPTTSHYSKSSSASASLDDLLQDTKERLHAVSDNESINTKSAHLETQSLNGSYKDIEVSSAPPAQKQPPPKDVHSDMYNTAFALQALNSMGGIGQGGSSYEYLSHCRTLWDGHMNTTSPNPNGKTTDTCRPHNNGVKSSGIMHAHLSQGKAL